MRASGAAGGAHGSWLPFALLWLAGADLRLTLLNVPPLLPLIHRDLALSETGVGMLTSLPVVLLAAAAVPGSLLIVRIGARRALITGILIMAVASGLRGVGPSVAVLFAMTFVMGCGLAITQTAMPSLVGQWTPARVGLATAIYVNGLLVGEAVGAALTLPVVLPLAGGSWALSLALWAVPMLATVVALATLTPRLPEPVAGVRLRWWPDWKRPETWQLGLLQGGVSAAYFGSNAFIPEFLHATGRSDLIGTCLTVLNTAQIPASLLGALWASRIVMRRGPFLAGAAAIVAGLGVFLLRTAWGPVLGAGILGFSFALILVLTLALPPLLAAPEDVHRLSAGMFAISYVFSFVVPLLGGAAWDLSRVPATSFLPVVAGALVLFAASRLLPLQGGARGRMPPLEVIGD